MQDKHRNNREKSKSNKNKYEKHGEYETFVLAGGKKDYLSGTTIPTEEGVISAKKFVEENKK